MVAAFNGDADIVQSLLKAGARSDLIDSEGHSARQFAADSPNIIALLQTAQRP
jgi:ankyrin repeat protein